jgi:hypothetical protein
MQGGSFKISEAVLISGCTELENSLSIMPIAVSVDASNWSSYRSGIFNNCTNSLNHHILLVGASSSGGFWKLKNSWGASWGESGFIRIASGNTCGVCTAGGYPK